MRVRISQSVINFKPRVLSTWKLEDWEGIDSTEDLLFFGLYNDRDYEVFNTYKGKKTVFWCGSDILFLMKDYERRRILKNHPDTEHFCENEVEARNLELCGIEGIKIVPSFLDNVNNFPASFIPTKRPQIFMCGHPNREDEYGFNFIRNVAKRVPEATFHLYGIDSSDNFFYSQKVPLTDKLATVDEDIPNIFHHGKVPEGEFNNHIMQYHCGLRTNDHDGFSEVTAKSILLGQYPISKIPYDGIWNYNTEDELVALIEKIKYVKGPNYEGRTKYLKTLNNFPWCKREYWNNETNK
jgi:hypothetical protein